MKTKTIKNTLLQSVAYGPHAAFMASRLKASFHASPAAIMALLAKHRLHQSKNIALRAEKPLTSPSPSEGGEHGSSPFFDLKVQRCGVLSLRVWRCNAMGRSGEVLFFSEAMFLLLDVCNNDSYVIRDMARA